MVRIYNEGRKERNRRREKRRGNERKKKKEGKKEKEKEEEAEEKKLAKRKQNTQKSIIIRYQPSKVKINFAISLNISGLKREKEKKRSEKKISTAPNEIEYNIPVTAYSEVAVISVAIINHNSKKK